LIADDFNYNLAQFDNLNVSNDNLNVSNFVELMFDNSYIPVINKPTRKSSAPIIDHIWTNMHAYPLKSAQFVVHCQIICQFFVCEL